MVWALKGPHYTLHHQKHSFCHSKWQHSIWGQSTIHFTMWALHKVYISNSWFNTLMSSLVYTESWLQSRQVENAEMRKAKYGNGSTEVRRKAAYQRLVPYWLTAACVEALSQRVTLSLWYESQILGSRTAWLPVSVARPKPRITVNGPTNDVGSMLLIFLWQWCKCKFCHNFLPRTFDYIANYSQDQVRLYTPCHAKQLY